MMVHRMGRICQPLRSARRRLSDEHGFTLVEMLATLAILLVVIGALVDGFASASKTEIDQIAAANDQQAARQALSRMRLDIHCATSAAVTQVTDPATGALEDAWLLNLQEPTGCLAVTTAASGASGVQWCTASVGGSTTNYNLYRAFSGTTCDASSANFQVGHLTTSDIWPATNCVQGQIPTVGVNMPVNRDPVTRPGRTYRLTDSIAMRNGSVAPVSGTADGPACTT